VKGVMVRLDELIQKIKADQTQRQHQKVDETLAISIFKSNVPSQGQSSTGLNGQFIHSQLLIECLIRMKPSADERQELINFCKKQYKNNPAELQIVKEFERDYSSDRSLWWYTRQSFLYRLLNKALRVQNIDLLYLFRFFIRDLGVELGKNKCSSPVHVYRAQQMSKEEVEILRKSIGEYISMNSFLSTSINREEAQSFLFSSDPSDDIEQVFFKIDADPRLENIKPFSNITRLSYFQNEKEVLFMIGSIFRLVEVRRDNYGIWNIRMMLCSENDNQLQVLFQHMKNQLGTKATDLYNFGGILREMGKLDEAEKYYHRYLDQLPDDHPGRSAGYHALGRVTNEKGDYDSSLKWFEKSLEIKIRTLKPDHPNIANTHNSIAIIHQRKHDYTRAVESYEKTLVIWKKVYGEDHPDVATCLSNMGVVYQEEKKYTKALEYHQKALFIREKHLPPDHSHLGDSHNNIGNTYYCLGDNDKALIHYNLSLKVKSKCLPPQHPDIGTTVVNIGLVHEKKGDFQQALVYFKRAAEIYRHSLGSTHPDVIENDQRIKRVSSKLK
jgi:tetratricopeptide (TPR) repeat protein